MSQVDCILGIAGLAIESVKAGKSIEVWAKSNKRPTVFIANIPTSISKRRATAI